MKQRIFLNNMKMISVFMSLLFLLHHVYMSRQKMAITLGVKAAKYQHVLLIGANTLIEKNSWLQAIGHSFKKDCNLFVVPGTYEESTNSFYQFAHLYTLSYLLNGYLKGRFDRINSNIVGFKKDEFIEQDGFRGGLEHVRVNMSSL